MNTQEFKKAYGEGRRDFTGVDFKNFNISGEHLTGSNLFFNDTTFSGDTNFSNVVCDCKLWFKKSKFFGNVDFKDAKINNGAYFGETIFCLSANFSDITSGGSMFFGNADFKDAYFDNAIFTDAVFYRTVFSIGGSMRGTQFNGKVNLRECKNYNWSTFNGKVFF